MGWLRKTGLVLTGVSLAALPMGAASARGDGPTATENIGLRDVSVLSRSDAWAVGNDQLASGASTTFVTHWDGHRWSQVDSPSPGDGVNVLGSVDAIAADDVWAVGAYQDGSRFDQLVEHWDGAAWTVVPMPTPPGDDVNFVELRAISAVGPDDIWAVGGYGDYYGKYSMAEHWDGTQWTLVSTGRPEGELVGTWARNSDDAWAITEGAGLEHWDGTSWTFVDSKPGDLRDIDGTSTSDVWAVGAAEGATTLAEHWNGTSWNVTKPAHGTRHKDRLLAVTAISPTDVWAVGSTRQPAHDDQALARFLQPAPMLEHWDGARWTRIMFPISSSRNAGYGLAGLGASQGDDVWVIVYDSGAAFLHWDGTSWSHYPSH